MHPQIAIKQPESTSDGGSETPAQRIWAIALIAIFTLVFFSFWWNRFLAGDGVDGVYYFAGKQILTGRIPYRDYLFPITPLDAIVDALLIRLFGDYLIVPRILGLIMRIVLASVMFMWLRRFFQPVSAFVGVMAGIIVFSASGADPVAGYNHNSSFWAVLAGFSASIALSRKDTGQWWPVLCSGAFASLCFLTKQTVGAGATAAIGTVLVLSSVWTDWPTALRRAIAFTGGWMIPSGIFAAWLIRAGAWPQFIDQVFISGPSSKGSLVQVFTRPLMVALHDPWLRQELAVAVVLMVAVVAIARAQRSEKGSASFRELVLIAAGGIVLMFVARALAVTSLATYARITTPHRILMFISLFGSIAVTAYYFVRLARGPMSAFEQQMWLLAGLSAAVAYMHSLSFVITEAMVLPALPFLITIGMDRLGRAPLQRLARGGMIAGAFAVSLTAATQKFASPFNWYGWKEPPVQFSTESSSIRQLAGIRMSPQARDFIERLTATLQKNLRSSSSEYAFFYLPLAYILTDGHPPTMGFDHFIDVAPDKVCVRDGETLVATRPSVIVYTPLVPGEILDWEKDFRGGQQSGQRDLIATLDRLIASDYRAVDTLHMLGSGRAVIVYARK